MSERHWRLSTQGLLKKLVRHPVSSIFTPTPRRCLLTVQSSKNATRTWLQIYRITTKNKSYVWGGGLMAFWLFFSQINLFWGDSSRQLHGKGHCKEWRPCLCFPETLLAGSTVLVEVHRRAAPAASRELRRAQLETAMCLAKLVAGLLPISELRASCRQFY